MEARDSLIQSPYFTEKVTYLFLEVDQLVDRQHQACPVQMIQSLLWSICIPFSLPPPETIILLLPILVTLSIPVFLL